MSKRFITMLLTLCMTAGLFAIMPITASAASEVIYSDDRYTINATKLDMFEANDDGITVRDQNISQFSEGYARVTRVGENSKLIDKTGKEVAFKDGWWPLDVLGDGLVYATRIVGNDVEYGYINLQSELIIEVDGFDIFTSSFHEGVARIGQSRIIDKTGNTVLLMSGHLSRFSEGLASITSYDDIRDGTGYCDGYVDITGNAVIDKRLYRAGDFSEGLASASNSEGKYGFINQKGEVAIPYEYRSIGSFSEGLAFASTNEYVYGAESCYIDATGKVVLRTLGLGGPFRDGVAFTEAGIIDRMGKVLVPNMSDVGSGIRFSIEAGSNYYFDNGLTSIKGRVGNKWYWYVLELTVKGDATTPPTPDAPSSWATDSVNAATAAGLVPESLQSKYTQATTRAEFCALAVALYEKYIGAEITERATFSDTTDVNVQKMAALGVVNGVGDGKFAPDDKLTREQAATMLARLANAVGKPIAAQAPTFADNGGISSWAFDAVGQMQATGIMGGVGNNTFAPKDPYTREQSIITIMRLWDLVNKAAAPEPTNTTPDAEFLSDAIFDEVKEYATSLGYTTFQAYPGHTIGIWQMSMKTRSGQCELGFVVDSRVDNYWSGRARLDGSPFPSEEVDIYNMDEMKAFIAKYADYE